MFDKNSPYVPFVLLWKALPYAVIWLWLCLLGVWVEEPCHSSWVSGSLETAPREFLLKTGASDILSVVHTSGLIRQDF